VAPWGRQSLGPNGEFEELTFGTHAIGDIVEEHLRWYDTRLRELDSGMDDEPPIQLFVMGSNEWRFEHEWPLERTEWTPLYLDRPADITASEMGRLSFEKPESESHNQFMYRPHDPCPSWGGQYQTLDLTGPRNRREIEERPDVLVYETGPPEDDIEVTGPVSARLFASTDVLDTDFTAVLTDVHPDGRAIILCEGICRARFRNGAETPELLTPGETYEFTIDLWDTSNVFLAGHRIRIEISSSNFPRYDRNLNTGGRIGYESLSDARAAQQTIFHGGGMASHVILPVIPKS
jgi:putative CocE/NonD family hydrolase